MGFIKRCNKIIKNNLIMQHTCPDIHPHGLATCVIVMELDLDLTDLCFLWKSDEDEGQIFISTLPLLVKRPFLSHF